MKIAFLFLTIGDLNHEYLWREYFKGNEDKYNIYCHPKERTNIKSKWMSQYIIKNIVKTEWGVILNAILELLKVAIKDKNNNHFVLLSESCIPLKSFNKFYKFLLKANNKSFVKNMKISEYDKFNLEKNVKKKFNFIKHYANWSLSRHHIKKLLIKEEDIKYFLKVIVQEEYFLSVLENRKDIIDYEINNVDWDYTNKFLKMLKNFKSKKKKINKAKLIMYQEISKHPRPYFEVNELIVKELINSESFFARKFHEESNILEFKDQLLAS